MTDSMANDTYIESHGNEVKLNNRILITVGEETISIPYTFIPGYVFFEVDNKLYLANTLKDAEEVLDEIFNGIDDFKIVS